MRILGVDPGIAECGWFVIEGEGDTLRKVAGGVVTTHKRLETGLRLLQISNVFREKVDAYKPDLFAYERVFMGRNVSSIEGVSYVIGTVYMVSATQNVPILPISPTEAKKALGHGKMGKKELKRAVEGLLGCDCYSLHESDAAAVAVAAYWKEGVNG